MVVKKALGVLALATTLLCSLGLAQAQASSCDNGYYCTPTFPLTAHSATLVNNNRAVAPASAPQAVKDMIAAANRIRHRPYKYGGGHRSFKSRAYDCSGAVSYVLHAAGFLAYPEDSGQLSKDWTSGLGHWVTIYANKDHVFMVIANLRFDTSYSTDGDRTGPGWSNYRRPTEGFRVRHLTNYDLYHPLY